MDECPVCLEPLAGTVVHLGCCRKSVHIQCYTTKCPLCRAELPEPIHAQPPPQHIIVPVPVEIHPLPISRTRIFIANFGLLVGTTGLILVLLRPYI